MARRRQEVEVVRRRRERLDKEIWPLFSIDEFKALYNGIKKLNGSSRMLKEQAWVEANLAIDEQMALRKYFDLCIERGIG
jgi:hypothetical protein